MKILHVVPTYLPASRYGGPIYSVHELCKGLSRLGHEVSIYTTNVDGNENSDVPLMQPVELDGLKVWYFPSRFLRRLYYSSSLAQHLDNHIKEFDMVHIHSIFLWPTLIASKMARKYNIPYIISPRGMLVKSLILKKSLLIKSIWIKLFETRNLFHSAAIHLTSKKEKDELLKFNFKLPNTVVIPNGIHQENWCENSIDEPQSIGSPYLLFLGRVNWKKGLDRLIEALQYVPDIALVIAGNDEDQYTSHLNKLAHEYSVQERMQFIGHVQGVDKSQLYRNAEMMILPSYSENFGIVVLEALIEECPVIVSKEVGAKEIVEESGGGLIVSGEPKELAEAINTMLSDTSRYARAKSAAEYVKKKYSWESISRDMEIAYNNTITNGLEKDSIQQVL